jgi:hypothetical protein
MEEHQNDLPAAFRQAFAAGQAAIAQAQTQEDGQQLLLTVHKHQRRLLELAPALVGQCEMQACALETQLAALVAQRIDEGLLDRQAVAMLLDQGPRAVRQYQFVGELAQTLDYFNQRFLTATEEGSLRETIREQGLAVEQALNGLLGHVVNEVLFDSQERSAMRRTVQELQRLGKLLEKPRDSGVLKGDYTIRRRQFIRQSGWLCLRVYGHVTTDLMVDLLNFKQSHYLAGAEGDDGDDELPLNAAINRELSTLQSPARKRSVSEQWETAAVVKAFLARSHWKAWRPI